MVRYTQGWATGVWGKEEEGNKLAQWENDE
jgi:hypothetical protein